MKDMQKIQQNLKHKHHNKRIRFSLEDKMSKVLKRIKETSQPEQQEIINKVVGEGQTNPRQKLKNIKRIMESSEQTQIANKKLVYEFFLNLHLKEYIFGNTESKQGFFNMIKLFNKVQPITVASITNVFEQFPLEEFSQIKYTLELLEFFTKNHETSKDEALRLGLIKEKLRKELSACVKIIFSDGFKLKWLEHFVDVLRAVNTLIKVLKGHLEAQYKESVLKELKQVLTQYKILTKQVLTQLYLLIIYLSPTQPPPEKSQGPCLIHYLHARNVILNQNTVSDLLQIVSTLKQTQYKCQVVPILLKAFENHFEQYPDKDNVFDQVVSLFEVGRSVYGYLEQIVTMIIKDEKAQWNLEGNYLRKFFIATIALKNNVDTQRIFKEWPNIIHDVIDQAGSMTIPYVADCASILFRKLYQESGKDYKKWESFWMQDYRKALLSEDRGRLRGIVEFINPILVTIDPEPTLLREIIALSKKDQSNAEMGVIALLKCYKDLGKIKIDNENKTFVHVDDPKIEMTQKDVQNLLMSFDSTMALKTLQFVTVHPKGSQPMEPVELSLALQFYKNCLKTSIPEFRKSYLSATKKMFERLRVVYEAEITKASQELTKKRHKSRPYFAEFKQFLSNLIDTCFMNIYPDVIFEIANPSLQLLLMIGQFFSRKRIEIKKGQILEAAHILTSTNYFKGRNFDNLLCCLQSSYESIRFLSHQIMELFYDLEDVSKLKHLWSESLINANKLTIKSYEYACRILAFISQVYPHVLDLPKKYSINELNICQLFLSIIKERYSVFKVQFASQQENYYKNLIHGMLTVFSYTLDHLATQIRAVPQKYLPHFGQLKSFLDDFFAIINQLVLFSVQVCSSNISTVMLDSLPQSQTDKKYKVDCRGHFLQQAAVFNKSTVGNLIESSALLTSMENQEEGIQNTLVVSFYVLTRQAGLVFQSISNLTASAHSQQYLPVDSLVTLVNSYFYALINLKHMGSVDRIAGGLSKMSRLIFENQDPKLSQLPQKLLQKLITNLTQGKFTNILRRSAGVPYAFTCLLKSQALKRKQMIQKTLKALLELSENNKTESIELRIHSLNILKKVFQDGDLKSDLDPYVSAAFIASIRGFTSEQWGVRNSSLMLFTVLSNRTVGIRPTYNLLQFFHRCPQLLQFFTHQLQNLHLNTMYPPLYPIVLLFSRLLPFDLKQHVRVPNKGELNLKQIRKDRLLLLLPLIEKAGLNSNHMGRVMAAKALLPFMDFQGIIPYCLQMLEGLHQIKENNIVHYRLAAVYNLLQSLQELRSTQKYQFKLAPETVEHLLQTLWKISYLITRKQSQVVVQLFFKIISHILEHYRHYFSSNQKYEHILGHLRNVTRDIMDKYFNNFDLIVPVNLGHSMAIRECLKLQIDLLYKYDNKPDHALITKNYAMFLGLLTQRLSKNQQYLKIADTQIIEEYLKHICEFLKEYLNNQELQKQIMRLLDKLDMQQIASDNILIQVLSLRSFLKVELKSQVETFLKSIEKDTKNHFLQIAIFKYFQAVNLHHEFILQLLEKYSKPEELEELRQCCVEFFEEFLQEKLQHYVVYVRLLEDEDYQIRNHMAKIIAKILKKPQLNDQVLKNIILSKFTLKQFAHWLQSATDFDTKRKNHMQQRIFAYDKPNKYRADINNFIFCLKHNSHIRDHRQELGKIIKEDFEIYELNWKEQAQACVHTFVKDIINRNEYQFEVALRTFLIDQEVYGKEMQEVFKGHPILEDLYGVYKGK